MSSWNVLLVDDDPTVLQVQGDLLSRIGHVVTMFTSALDALEYLESYGRDVDLVITDFRMPKMNGLEFVQRVRESFEDMPIMILTGYANEVDPNKVADYDVKVVSKPVGAKILSEYIDKLTQRSAS